MYDNIIIYEDKRGKSEINEYIEALKNSITKEDRIKLKKIDMYLRLLSENGLTIGEPYIKHIDAEIWELRPVRDRILFASWYNNKFILLSVFLKQSRKTPRKEILKAKRLLNDYIKRSGRNE